MGKKREVIFDDTPIESVICCECGRRYKWKNKQGGNQTKEKIEEMKKKFVCGRCEFQKKKITNKWYDPKFDRRSKSFIGKFSMNTQEFGLLIKKYQRSGLSYAEAKQKVCYDMRQMNRIKWHRRYEGERAKAEQQKQIANQIENKKKLVGGLK